MLMRNMSFSLGSPEHPLSDVIPWKIYLERLIEKLGWSLLMGWDPFEQQWPYLQRMIYHEEVLKQCDGLDGVITFPVSSVAIFSNKLML